MDRLLLISAVEPSRSPIVAALEGTYDVVRRSPDAHPAEYQTLALDGMILEISDGLPVIAAVRRLIRSDASNNIPLLVVVDSVRVGLLQHTPEIFDFVIKPFANDELRLRIMRMITKVRGFETPERLEANGVRLMLDERRAYIGGNVVHLTLREFELLRYLLLHKNRAYSREQLLSAVWGFDYEGGSRTVDIHIRRLRTKLGANIAPFIQTVHGIGYRFGDANVADS